MLAGVVLLVVLVACVDAQAPSCFFKRSNDLEDVNVGNLPLPLSPSSLLLPGLFHLQAFFLLRLYLSFRLSPSPLSLSFLEDV